jgi:hypothetical protein
VPRGDSLPGGGEGDAASPLVFDGAMVDDREFVDEGGRELRSGAIFGGALPSGFEGSGAELGTRIFAVKAPAAQVTSTWKG